MNPIDYLASVSTEIQAMAYTMNANSGNSQTNDVSDIFDISATFLTTIVMDLIGTEPDVQIAQIQAECNRVLQEQEHKFTQNAESLLQSITDRMDELNEQVQQQENRYSSDLSNITQLNFKNLDILEKQQMQILKDSESEFSQKRKAKKEELHYLYAETETAISRRVGELGIEYKQKLEDIDAEIRKMQSGLQSIIHNKHAQRGIAADGLDEENRRYSQAHEQLSIDNERKKAALVDEKARLETTVVNMRQDMISGQADIFGRNKRLEEEMTEQNNERAIANRAELERLQSLIDQHNATITQLRTELDRMQIDASMKAADIEKDYAEKIATEKRATVDDLLLIDKEMTAEWQPKLDTIQWEIMDFHEVIRKEQASAQYNDSVVTTANEKEIDVLEKKHKADVARLTQMRNEATKALKDVKVDMARDLEAITLAQQQRVGEAMVQTDAKDHERAAEVSEMMKMFEEQQQKLSQIQNLSIEQRNQYKAEQVARLKEMHEKRRIALLQRIEEERAEMEQRELNAREQEENQQFDNDMNNIKMNVTDLTSRIELLQVKLESLAKMQSTQVAEMLEDYDPQLRADIAKVREAGSSEAAGVVDLAPRLERESYEMMKRKSLVTNEADQIQVNIDVMKGTFERRITQMEHQYAASGQHLEKMSHSVDAKQRFVTQKVDTQQAKLQDLSIQAAKKETEMDEFEQNAQKELEEYEEQTKIEFQANLDQMNEQPAIFQNQMEEVRDGLTMQINDLKARLAEARKNTEEIMKLMEAERTQNLEEAEAQLTISSEEKLRALKEATERRIQKMSADLEVSKRQKEKKLVELDEEHHQDQVNNLKHYNDQRNELHREELALQQEEATHDERIYFITNTECKECRQKKDALRIMMKRRAQLLATIERTRQEYIHADHELTAIFRGDSQTRRVQNQMAAPPKSPQVTKPRAMTAFGHKTLF